MHANAKFDIGRHIMMREIIPNEILKDEFINTLVERYLE